MTGAVEAVEVEETSQSLGTEAMVSVDGSLASLLEFYDL
jgi:hypothetical protein